mgnify:CR=1 FL=1
MLNQKESELIFNDDGSVYHLKLKPSNIAGSIILVGDPQRVELISKHFQSIEFSVTNREFKTITGIYKNKRISVISTGIGSGNIDIVLNELDSLVNIDFKTRKLKPKLTKLNLIRIGTSGAIQKDIPIDSLLISSKGIDIDGFLNNYKISNNHTYNEVNNHLNDYKFNNQKEKTLMSNFYNPNLDIDLDSPFTRDEKNKLIRRSYWVDKSDKSLLMLMDRGIGRQP